MKYTIEVDVPEGFSPNIGGRSIVVGCSGGCYLTIPLETITPRKLLLTEQFTDTLEHGMYYTYSDNCIYRNSSDDRPKTPAMETIWALTDVLETGI